MWSMTAAIFLTILYSVSGETPQNGSDVMDVCNIGIPSESVITARRQFETYLNDNARMIYFYLLGDTKVRNIFDANTFDRKEENGLTSWIWVSEKKTYLLQLPVDTDAATFGLMRKNVYNINIEMKVFGNRDNCSFNKMNTSDKVFDTLFNNITVNGDHDGNKLCRRTFENQHGREILFGFTSIWVGYDFKCYIKDTNDTTLVHKSSSTICMYVIEFIIFHFYLFFFIFLCDESHNQEYSDTYVKGEIPYHPQRFLYRYLHDGICENKSLCYSLIPAIRLILTWSVLCLPFMLCYSIYFKKYIPAYGDYYEVYMHKDLLLWFSLPFFVLITIFQLWLFEVASDEFVFFYLLKFPPELNVFYNTNIEGHLQFERNEKQSLKLISRLQILFTCSFWRTMFANMFNLYICNWYKIPFTIFNFPLNIILTLLNILSCISPIVWICFVVPLNLISIPIKRFNLLGNRMFFTVYFIVYCLYCFVVPITGFDLFAFYFRPVSYASRCIIYTLFIAIPNLDSVDFHYYLVLFAAISYALKFVHSYLDICKCLLSLMFEIKRAEETAVEANGEIPRIYIKDFDKIVEKSFPWPLYGGIICLKITIVSCFIGISTTILIESRQGNDVIINLLAFFAILFSPGIVISLFLKSNEEVVKDKEEIIMQEIKMKNIHLKGFPIADNVNSTEQSNADNVNNTEQTNAGNANNTEQSNAGNVNEMEHLCHKLFSKSYWKSCTLFSKSFWKSLFGCCKLNNKNGNDEPGISVDDKLEHTSVKSRQAGRDMTDENTEIKRMKCVYNTVDTKKQGAEFRTIAVEMNNKFDNSNQENYCCDKETIPLLSVNSGEEETSVKTCYSAV